MGSGGSIWLESFIDAENISINAIAEIIKMPMSKIATLSILFSLVVVSCNDGSKERPIGLPPEAVDKLDGTAAFSEEWAVASVYNGTDWNITDFDALVVVEKTHQSRRYRLQCADGGNNLLQPYSTKNFRGTGDAFLKGLTKSDTSWRIIGARGFKR